MKEHILLKVRQGFPAGTTFPFWGDVITDHTHAPRSFYPEIDTILNEFGITVSVTHEYKPEKVNWSPVELHSGLDRIFRLILRENRSVSDQLLDLIREVPLVEYVRRGPITKIVFPEKPVSTLSLRNFDESRESVGLSTAHRTSRGDQSIVVAVLDTGICTSHPEFKTNLLDGYDFVNIISDTEKFIGDSIGYDSDPSDEWNGHGTHVAGIIGAQGIAMSPGVAPLCKILPVRVLAAMKAGNKTVGAGLEDNVSSAIKWAVDKGADVINMSLGVEHKGGGLPYKEVVDYASEKGVTIVAAAGNSPGENLYYPGALPYVITVGSTNNAGLLSPFSTIGRQVSLTAPGEAIYSSFVKNGYAYSSGTSQAAAFVTGAVALLKSHAHKLGYTLNDSQVKYLLHQTSDKFDERFRHHQLGYGKINLVDALKLLGYELGSRKYKE